VTVRARLMSHETRDGHAGVTGSMVGFGPSPTVKFAIYIFIIYLFSYYIH